MIQVLSILALALFASPATAWWEVNAPLHYAAPQSVGLLPQPLLDLKTNASAYTVPRNYGSATHNEVHPLYPGVTVLVAHRNAIVSHFAVGKTLLYADANGTLLPEDQQIDSREDTIYDMASISKLFTTILALDQLGQGTIQLDHTVASYLPEFATNNKSDITILQLLTHTSGFDADPVPPLYPNYTTYDARREACITQAPINPPGSTFLYSDLNFLNLGFVLETVTGKSLDQLLHDQLTSKLGMSDTFYNVGNKPAEQLPNYYRTAATEYQIQVLGQNEPPRPQPVRGSVHDENSWSLNGVAGHAGVFSTAYDLGVFCQMILNNGSYHGTKILEPWTVDLIFHNYNTQFPDDAHGLGFELNQTYWSGPMRSLETAGHTGFTGTTLFIDRPSATFAIQLAHRVHPSRQWSSTNIAREYIGYFVAQALGRNPVSATA
ncbi:putative beta-lactamase [Papiliotrema laurentii]|uniref:Beta-lactamase n=1 Tax=Papiliotrema laurentii TaxID=5418 RepID=A0AAD9FQN2_PAPLA|nr:putative beta-lactamase [Papiliotrema laurentii]